MVGGKRHELPKFTGLRTDSCVVKHVCQTWLSPHANVHKTNVLRVLTQMQSDCMLAIRKASHQCPFKQAMKHEALKNKLAVQGARSVAMGGMFDSFQRGTGGRYSRITRTTTTMPSLSRAMIQAAELANSNCKR